LHASLARAAEALWPTLDELVPGVSIEVVAQTDSTNTQLLQRARAGDASPTVMVALEQTAGRGRQGRRWHAAPGDSLTFSLALPWPVQMGAQTGAQPGDAGQALSGLSLAVGVALAEVLDPAVRLKWPNDLWLHGRKLGGILIEITPVAGSATQRVVVVGVGLNVATSAPLAGALLPPTTGPAPVGMAALDEVDSLATAARVFERVVPALLRAWTLFTHSGWGAFAARFAQRDALLGQAVQLWQAGSAAAEGMAQGVDGQGRLLVHTAHGLQAWSSGEVSARLGTAATIAPPSSSD
jgi:BirA family biotin operon repressor/biotin-[acetyl-CoA-carboxylase] ligase